MVGLRAVVVVVTVAEPAEFVVAMTLSVNVAENSTVTVAPETGLPKSSLTCEGMQAILSGHRTEQRDESRGWADA